MRIPYCSNTAARLRVTRLLETHPRDCPADCDSSRFLAWINGNLRICGRTGPRRRRARGGRHFVAGHSVETTDTESLSLRKSSGRYSDI
jgi:hypothetical protein